MPIRHRTSPLGWMMSSWPAHCLSRGSCANQQVVHVASANNAGSSWMYVLRGRRPTADASWRDAGLEPDGSHVMNSFVGQQVSLATHCNESAGIRHALTVSVDTRRPACRVAASYEFEYPTTRVVRLRRCQAVVVSNPGQPHKRFTKVRKVSDGRVLLLLPESGRSAAATASTEHAMEKPPPHQPGPLHDRIPRLRDAVRRPHHHLGRLRDRLGVGVGMETTLPCHKASQAVKSGPQDLSAQLLEDVRRHREGERASAYPTDEAPRIEHECDTNSNRLSGVVVIRLRSK